MLSVDKIKKLFGITAHAVTKILRAHNVKLRNASESHKLPVDSNYFEVIDTEDKAYWLGFMYADGYVTKNIMGVKLRESDSEHLEKFKQALKSSHKIGHYVLNSGFSQGLNAPYCSLTIVDDKLVADLKRCGVVPNKSKVVVFPTELIVPRHLVHHFIRGYFDGDGSVYGSAKAPAASFDGTKEFLDVLLKILKEAIGTNCNVHHDHSIYCIKLGGHNIIKQLFQYMYKDATVFLGRKKQRFEEYLA